ncbi:unnamed protein product [Heligmosomoides polygyrus]|uniref:Lipase_3 domain-containing protein n=1 Tax=Heligmosomoides polygyrus TaxID=6339 RepID=A0A183F6A4_HELPZ|nr:unnamed protein product [Heligmosomoides polygyrus]
MLEFFLAHLVIVQGQLLLEGLQAIDHGVEFFDLGTVNKYFMNGLLVLWPQVEETLTNPKYAVSLRSGDQITMYTFGEPRVGDVTFAKNFDSMIKNSNKNKYSFSYRVVFHQDIVPHLPACNKDKTGLSNSDGSRPCDSNDLSKPYHHGTEIWYPDSMAPGAQYTECVGEPSGEDFACSDALKFHYDQDKSYISDHRHYFSVRVSSLLLVHT